MSATAASSQRPSTPSSLFHASHVPPGDRSGGLGCLLSGDRGVDRIFSCPRRVQCRCGAAGAVLGYSLQETQPPHTERAALPAVEGNITSCPRWESAFEPKHVKKPSIDLILFLLFFEEKIDKN